MSEAARVRGRVEWPVMSEARVSAASRMAKTVSLVLSEDEAKFLFSALDRVEIQGIGAARALSSVAEKLSIASRFAGERAEPRLPLEQALLARITPVPRNGDKTEPTKEPS